MEREPGGVHRHPDLPGCHAVVPVVAGRVDHGRIVALSSSEVHHLDATDIQLLERAATVAALVVTKAAGRGRGRGKYRGDFLRDVLSSRAGSRDRVVAHCRSLGWDVERPLVVVVAELDPGADATRSSAGELRPARGGSLLPGLVGCPPGTGTRLRSASPRKW